VSQQINLYNPLFEPRREWISFNVAATVVLALVALLVLAIAWLDMRDSSLATRELATAQRLNQAKEEMTRLAGQLTSRQKDPRLEAELDRARIELESRDKVVELLQGGALGNTLGYSEYLRAFARQSVDGLWLTGFSIAGAGHNVTIEGRTLRAELVPDYLQRLNRERIMQGRSFSEMQMRQPAREPGEKKAEAPGFLEFKVATVPEAPAAKEAGR
jgi:hypothetical protein